MPLENGLAKSSTSSARKPANQVTLDHYLRVIWHRKWIVLITFVIVTATTAVVAYRMPDIYTSETVVLVDPQKVPESYVKPTVTGDVRNRLGTLQQQILSGTRLQKIIDTLNLYPVERKTMNREDIILKMKADISVSVVSDYSSNQDLQAFRIRYSGRDPRVVAQVANQLASQFIDENLKARTDQATGTNEFLENQLKEARAALESQEAKLREFRLRHLGEMPEQQTASLQILGQLQSQLQLESEALARAEQQRDMTQAMATQTSPVVDVDPIVPTVQQSNPVAPKATKLAALRAQLASLQGRYTAEHPEIRKLRAQIADEEKREEQANGGSAPAKVDTPAVAAAQPAAPAVRRPAPRYSNPVLESQLRTIQEEISKHKQEQARLQKLIAGYQRKLESIPVNEQAVAALVRDYDISKSHYQQLLNNQLSAETATQLEIRQKGEKFSVLDRAVPAERPSRPNRPLINAAGAVAGLGLGLLLALVSEVLGMSITTADQMANIAAAPVLEVIPVIETKVERRIRRRRTILATVSTALLLVIGAAVAVAYRLQS